MRRANHHARVESSVRLQKALALLESGKWCSTLEIAQAANTAAPGSTISELRSNGYHIESRFGRVTESGRKVWEYRLVKQEVGRAV